MKTKSKSSIGQGLKTLGTHSDVYPERSKTVLMKFTCKKCGRDFWQLEFEDSYFLKLHDSIYTKSKLCNKCKMEKVKNTVGRMTSSLKRKCKKNS